MKRALFIAALLVGLVVWAEPVGSPRGRPGPSGVTSSGVVTNINGQAITPLSVTSSFVDAGRVMSPYVSGLVVDAGTVLADYELVGTVDAGRVVTAYGQIGAADAGVIVATDVLVPTAHKVATNLGGTSYMTDSSGALRLVSGTQITQAENMRLDQNGVYYNNLSGSNIAFWNIGSGVYRWYTDSADNASQAAYQWGGSVTFAGTSPYFKILNNAGTIFTLYGSGSLELPGREIHTVQTVTGTDDGAGTNRAVTITPSSSHIALDCQDTNGCDVTMSETGATEGARICITAIGAGGASNFADTSGVSELAGAFAAGIYDTICMMYTTSRWVELSRSNN